MSQVIDFNEKEKEETILFLAEALICENPQVVKKISDKVHLIVLPFLVDVATKMIKNEGGEKVGSIGTGKESEKI